MTIWVDAQMSPAIAAWISGNFSVRALPVRDLSLRDATDREIFDAARRENVVVMTKDNDFVLIARQIRATTTGNLGDMWQYFERTPQRNPYEHLA